jgi:polyisoprenoid-binding protein YceI
MKVIPAVLGLMLLSACSSAVNATEAPATPEPTRADVEPGSSPVTGQMVLTIAAEGTQARFLIGEILAGSPNTVIGETQEVSGEIRVDPADPAAVELGLIQIDAASFVTDNSFRNRAINSFILQTGDHPFVTFEATELVGLPETVAVGDAFDFELVGDLTIRDITRSVTFAVNVTVESSTRLTGSARATINRADFDLTIPSVPQVASVDEQVRLELDFVAEADA